MIYYEIHDFPYLFLHVLIAQDLMWTYYIQEEIFSHNLTWILLPDLDWNEIVRLWGHFCVWKFYIAYSSFPFSLIDEDFFLKERSDHCPQKCEMAKMAFTSTNFFITYNSFPVRNEVELYRVSELCTHFLCCPMSNF